MAVAGRMPASGGPVASMGSSKATPRRPQSHGFFFLSMANHPMALLAAGHAAQARRRQHVRHTRRARRGLRRVLQRAHCEREREPALRTPPASCCMPWCPHAVTCCPHALFVLRFRDAFMLRFCDASCYIGTAIGAQSTAATTADACGNAVVGIMHMVQADASGNAGSADGCLWQRWRGHIYIYTACCFRAGGRPHDTHVTCTNFTVTNRNTCTRAMPGRAHTYICIRRTYTIHQAVNFALAAGRTARA